MHPIQNVIFDCDGLLLDTERLHTIANNKLLHDLNKPSIDSRIKGMVMGKLGHEVAQIIVEEYKLPLDPQEFRAKILVLEVFCNLYP